MADENSMVVKPKLNFFQRFRKNRLIKRINLTRYNKAPDYLKQDDEVILALVERNPSAIMEFPLEKRLDILKSNPGAFESMSQGAKYDVIKKEPTFITRFSEQDVLIFITDRENTQYVKYLPEEFQFKLLTEENKYQIRYRDFTGRTGLEERKIKPDDFATRLEHFSPNVVEKAAIHLVDLARKEQKSHRYTEWERVRGWVPLLSKMEITNLPIETQMKLALLDSEFLKTMSFDAVKRFVGNNPLLIADMPRETQKLLVKENPELYKMLPRQAKKTIIEDYSLRGIVSDEEKLNLSYDFRGSTYIINDPEVFKRELVRYNWKNALDNATYTDHIRDNAVLAEVARFEPSILATWGLDQMVAYRKTGYAIRIYKDNIRNPEVHEALDRMQQNIIRMDTYERNKFTENMPKILLNEEVGKKVNPSLIVDYLRNPNDMEIVRNIVEAAYGPEARKILDERPGISLDQIPNLYIFDPIVTEKFGRGTVENMLSYSTVSSSVISDLVRHPDKMKKFEELSSLLETDNKTALTFDNQLIIFKRLEESLKDIDLTVLTDKQKDNLRLLSNDCMMTEDRNETSFIAVKTIEDLDSYDVRRAEMYDDYMKKSTSTLAIKEALSRRFFGVDYEFSGGAYKQNGTSLTDMVRYYNLENFIKDERTVNSPDFSQDELDMLKLATIITKIDDPKVLKEIYEELASRDDVLRPIDFKSTKEKIPMQYSKELVESLLTVEDAKKRAENGEQGIAYEKREDGIELIKLNGADFRIMLHTTGMNNSGLRIPYSASVDKIWKYYESGCSTISSCVIEPEMLKSCASTGGINLGFAKVPAKQIIGMSHRDAHVTHTPGAIDPQFDYGAVMFNYPDELIRKTAAQITGQEDKDTTHEYNEVAMYRKYVDAENKENYGKKVMPDYLVVYGPANGKHFELAKSFAGPDGKPIPIIEIDVKAYGDRTYMRGYRKEDHATDRKQGEIVDKVTEIINKENEREER